MYWHSESRRYVQERLPQWSGGTIPTTGAHPIRRKPTTHGRSGPDTHGRDGPAIHWHGGPATYGRNDGPATHGRNCSPATHGRNGNPKSQGRSFDGARNSIIILHEKIN